LDQNRRSTGVLKPKASLWAIVAVLIPMCAVALGPRGVWIPFWEGGVDAQIVRDVRVPRVLLGFLAGSALAIAGMAFQALFRNALATPYTVGVSAGASLGAAVYVYADAPATLGGMPGQALAAFAGGVTAITFVYGLARAAADFSTATLLLAGVAVSFLCTSVILAIQYVGDVSTSFRIGRWLVGGVEVVGFTSVLQTLPFVFIGIVGIAALSRELDLLVISDESARSRGVAVQIVKRLIFALASLMVGAVVATCGPIGFVGLVVPHVGRLLVGPRHCTLAPFCIAMGGAFLVTCDAVGRTVVAPIEIPVGIITALIGGPFFLGLLVQGQARSSQLSTLTSQLSRGQPSNRS
jgi:iron complex transport system permease protein